MILQVKELSLRFNSHHILSGINLDFEEGKLYAIIGPNGAGKSSLIKCLCRLHAEYQGQVHINGQTSDELSSIDIAKSLAYVPQQADSNIPFSLYDFLKQSFFVWETNDDEIIRQIEDVLQLTDLQELKNHSMNTLSGGERQRAFIAAALCQQSPIILLDEVTSALDPKHRKNIEKLLLKIKTEQNKTLLWISHDINAALQHADEIIALKDGTVSFHGSPETILQEEKLEQLFDYPFQRIPHARGTYLA